MTPNIAWVLTAEQIGHRGAFALEMTSSILRSAIIGTALRPHRAACRCRPRRRLILPGLALT